MTDTKDGGTASLWDINHERAEDRIRARRKRISNRLEAAKRLATILKVQSIFGAAGGPGAAQGKDAAEVVLVEGKYVLVSGVTRVQSTAFYLMRILPGSEPMSPKSTRRE